MSPSTSEMKARWNLEGVTEAISSRCCGNDIRLHLIFLIRFMLPRVLSTLNQCHDDSSANADSVAGDGLHESLAARNYLFRCRSLLNRNATHGAFLLIHDLNATFIFQLIFSVLNDRNLSSRSIPCSTYLDRPLATLEQCLGFCSSLKNPTGDGKTCGTWLHRIW